MRVVAHLLTIAGTAARQRYIGVRSRLPVVADSELGGFGRYAGPATLILSSLAEGPKHGYALTKDIEAFAGVRLAPGTLYEALTRLEGQGLIKALKAQERRKPYQLTAAGAAALRTHLADQRRVADVGLRRLKAEWGPA
jgi:DNA-binding PadR family transcriptional regulator